MQDWLWFTSTVFFSLTRTRGKFIFCVTIYTYFKLFLFFFFWLHRAACRILVPRPGIEPGPPQRKCRVLTTGLPGNSLNCFILNSNIIPQQKIKPKRGEKIPPLVFASRLWAGATQSVVNGPVPFCQMFATASQHNRCRKQEWALRNSYGNLT